MNNVDGLYRFNRLRTKVIIVYSNTFCLLIIKKIEFQVTDVSFSLFCIVKVLQKIAAALSLLQPFSECLESWS